MVELFMQNIKEWEEVCFQITYRRRGKRVIKQQECKIKIGNLLKKEFKLGKRARKKKKTNGKIVAKIAIENALTLYKNGVGRIKIEKICMALNSDLANTALDYARGYAYNKLGQISVLLSL